MDVDAKTGDSAANVNGTLLTLGLPGSDLRFSASVADAARLASAFDVTGVPAEALEVSGHVVSSRKEIKLDGVNAKFAGAEAKADGSIRAGRDRGAAITFAVTAESLARLREGLPEIPFRASGSYTGSRDTQELQDLKAVVGKTEISGSAKLGRKDPKADRGRAPLAQARPDALREEGEGGRRGPGREREADGKRAEEEVRLRRNAPAARQAEGPRTSSCTSSPPRWRSSQAF